MIKYKTLISTAAALIAAASPAYSVVVLNEVIGSTTSADTEFIELYNAGTTAVDISGWFIEEIESDPGASLGTVDDTFTLAGSDGDGTVVLGPGAFYLIANATFITEFGITPDLELALSIENSSYTLVLNQANGDNEYVAYVSDADGAGAQDGNGSVTPDIAVGPDGTFLPAGYALTTDGGSEARVLEFSPRPAPSATPGTSNIPEPSSALLGGIALLGLLRRRR